MPEAEAPRNAYLGLRGGFLALFWSVSGQLWGASRAAPNCPQTAPRKPLHHSNYSINNKVMRVRR